jgi:hypothetical protein
MTLVDDLPRLPGRTGYAERWDEDRIALLALIALADLNDAVRVWRRFMPGQHQDRLAADVNGFDESDQEYQDVAIIGLIALLYVFITRLQRRVVTITQRMLDGGDQIDLWQEQMAGLLRPAAVAMFALGRGGIERITLDDIQTISETLEFQYVKLREFAVAVEGGFPDPRAVTRARMYPASLALLFHQARRIGHETAGFTEERRVLTPAEHCPDCPPLAGLSWQPIGTLPDIGIGTRCQWNCKCYMEFR